MFIVVIFAMSAGLPAGYCEAAGRVVMRFSDKGDYQRFVFQSRDATLINSSVVNNSSGVVKIDFPDSFSFDGVPLPQSVSIVQKGNSVYLTVNNLVKIQVSRYQVPPRLVIDAYVAGDVRSPLAPKDNESTTLSIELDAGHGGVDTGIISGQFKESSLTLAVCSEIAKRIGSRTVRVAIDRKDDEAVSISERLADIHRVEPNLLISLHVSASSAFAIYTSCRA